MAEVRRWRRQRLKGGGWEPRLQCLSVPSCSVSLIKEKNSTYDGERHPLLEVCRGGMGHWWATSVWEVKWDILSTAREDRRSGDKGRCGRYVVSRSHSLLNRFLCWVVVRCLRFWHESPTVLSFLHLSLYSTTSSVTEKKWNLRGELPRMSDCSVAIGFSFYGSPCHHHHHIAPDTWAALQSSLSSQNLSSGSFSSLMAVLKPR